MNKMRLKPALHYQLDYMVRASLSYIGVLAVIIIFISLIRRFFGGLTVVNILGIVRIDAGGIGGGQFTFNVGGLIIFILFVIGIVGIREDLKLFLQHGMGRATTYFSTLIISLICAVSYGLFCELLNLAFIHWPNFPVRAMFFPAQSFFAGWFFHASLFFFAWQLGVLISLIYYRMNGVQQTVFSVAGVAMIMFALPGGIRRIAGGEDLEAALVALLANPAFLPLWGVLAAAGSFLLLRRAQVKD